MFALVETWFSSLPTTCVSKAGSTPTRAARAIASAIRSVVVAAAPPPAALHSLQLLFAICISKGSESGKAACIQAAALLAIDGFRDGNDAPAPADAVVSGDVSDAFEFLFPTEL
jgi:hypothetical protein